MKADILGFVIAPLTAPIVAMVLPKILQVAGFVEFTALAYLFMAVCIVPYVYFLRSREKLTGLRIALGGFLLGAVFGIVVVFVPAAMRDFSGSLPFLFSLFVLLPMMKGALYGLVISSAFAIIRQLAGRLDAA